ncbi:formate dehydrogenase accessory sulfurtransferase FdhD [Lagierella sp.]|uniref:formate dehydrogenase accessory sulfurtransferase FdhD n=1 Tax=Lagierella sp. TaxID=2849657 RepID=UPI002628E1DC|nr:formate dehydrogenase accessory sulfurtransferase FdhD [Lagierella sp.]
MEDRTLKYEVLTYNDGNCSRGIENVVEEVNTKVIVNGKKTFNLTSSPFNIEELVIGNMWMRNLLDKKEDIKTIKYTKGLIEVELNILLREEERKYRVVKSDLTLAKKQVPILMKELQDRANLFSRTGGVHNAAISDGQRLLVFMEDIGRHNTVDKLMGYCILNDISLEDKIMVFSGRIPFEIINKLSKMNVPIFISKSAPTSLGVEMARKYNITLCGFTRGERYHIYSDDGRIL